MLSLPQILESMWEFLLQLRYATEFLWDLYYKMIDGCSPEKLWSSASLGFSRLSSWNSLKLRKKQRFLYKSVIINLTHQVWKGLNKALKFLKLYIYSPLFFNLILNKWKWNSLAKSINVALNFP